MHSTLKRMAVNTTMAVALLVGASVYVPEPAMAQAGQCTEPLYDRDANGRLVRVGSVIVACPASAPALTP